MAVAQHNIEKWFGPAYDAMVPPQNRERFQAVREQLRTSSLTIMRFTEPGADQTLAIRRLRECMMCTMFTFIESR
jgi:hypothetical protein